MLILLIFHVYYGNKTVSEYFYSRQVSVGICEVKATLRQPPVRRGSVFDFPDRRNIIWAPCSVVRTVWCHGVDKI